MNQLKIDKMNEKISYEEGKIYWEWCNGHTAIYILKGQNNNEKDYF